MVPFLSRSVGFFHQMGDPPVQVVHSSVRMAPFVRKPGFVQFTDPCLGIRLFQQGGTGRHEQPYGVLDRVDVVDQVVHFDEIQQLQVVVQRRPGREGHQRGPHGQVRFPQDGERADDVLPVVPFRQATEHEIADRFDGRDDEDPAQVPGFGEERRMLQDMFDLGGKVEGEAGMGVAHPSQDAQNVRGTVQKIGVPEGDVARSHAHLLVDVGQHHVGGHGEKPAVVHRRDRAMQARVETTPRRLGVPGGHLFRPGIQLGVPFQRGQAGAVRYRPLLAGKMGRGGRNGARRGVGVGPGVPGGALARAKPVHQVAERLFELAADHRIGAVGQEIIGVQGSVESVKAQVRVRIEDPDAARQVHPDPHGRVHGHRDTDKPGAADGILGDRLDGRIDRLDLVPFRLQAGGRGGQAEGLMTQFIAGYEQDTIFAFHHASSWYLW